MISQNKLKHLLSYDEESGLFTWLNPTSVRVKVGSICDSRKDNGHIQIQISGKVYLTHRLAWLYKYGHYPKGVIDHINGIPDDNRMINLRDVSQYDNTKNAKLSPNNTSGHNGISWDNSRNKWITYINSEGKRKFLGRYSSLEEAIKIRDKHDSKENYHPNHGRDGSL